MKNQILIKYPKNWGLDEEMVVEMMTNVLVKRGYKENMEVSLAFVGRKYALDLNIKYRQRTYVPQVLGFPMDKEKSADGYIHLGDIVICTQKLKYEVEFQKSTLAIVLKNWLEHGLDNLLI